MANSRVCLTAYVGPPRGGCYERMQRLVGSLLRRGWTVHYVGLVPLETGHPALLFHPVRSLGSSRSSLWTVVCCAGRAVTVCFKRRVRFLWGFGAAYAVILAPLRLLPGRRLLTFLRGSLVEQERARGAAPLRILLAEAVEGVAARVSDKVLAVSRDLARRAGMNAEVLPNHAGVPLSPLDAKGVREQFGLPRGVFVVGYAGSISPIKSLETLLWAVARVPGVHVALLGFSDEETPYERSIRGLTTELKLTTRAHLLGWTRESGRFLVALDVVILPSRHEGCPNLLLEAMAMGRPCLGARSGGIEEMLIDEALLFPVGDVGRLAARLKELRDEPQERERLTSLVRARAAAYDFDWDERAAATLEASFWGEG